MIILGIAALAFTATFIGGSFALKFRDKLHLILGFSAGAVAGVALFDLLPEAIELGSQYHDAATIALFVALGLFGYLILDRLILLHTHEADDEGEIVHTTVYTIVHTIPDRGAAGALTLAAHSLLDGVAIGVGFAVAPALGAVVALAVLTHDFSDGINTVSLVLRNGGTQRRAFYWLLVDAVAPVVGAASTLFFTIPASAVGLVLAVFVGTFLYLSAADLIPESHHRHPRALTTFMTLLGAFIIWAVVSVV
jgi:ZIP family zinc transporter